MTECQVCGPIDSSQGTAMNKIQHGIHFLIHWRHPAPPNKTTSHPGNPHLLIGSRNLMSNTGEMKREGSPHASLLKEATELLGKSEEDAVARWSALPTAALLSEIEKHQDLIKALEKSLPQTESSPCDEEPDGPTEKLDDLNPADWEVPPHCIPIHADVTQYNWNRLSEACQFDVVMMDPPWLLATSNPTRGVALGYGQLTNKDIMALPIPKLQTNGLLFIWVINSSYDFAIGLFKQWGYKIVDEVVWVKLTVNRRLAKSHGYYLQHAKEVCLVGMKGKPANMRTSVGSDVIMSERRGQSQKPEEIYELAEQLVPGGKYLEIFARKNNLRNFWVSIGNEVCMGVDIAAASRRSHET